MGLYRVVEDGNHTFLIHDDMLDYYRSKQNCDVYELVERPLDGASTRSISQGHTETKIEMATNNENN